MIVRTRFAPSPTGHLHIGGVRTALFNWLFARHYNGQFVLRIDDTDQERNLEQAIKPILEGFRWLGLDWDEGPDVGGPYAPYFQSERHERYSAVVDQLIAHGYAYRDYAKTEEIQAERNVALRAKRRFIYSRRWMARSDQEAISFEAEGRKAVIRLQMPREGQCEFDDLIHGHIEFEWALEQDHVVQRADGSFLYHLASAVDDHDYRITHVIRAVEHLSNTPRQIFIAQCLNYHLPKYAHLPYVAAPGSAEKLSKRKLDTYLKHPEFKKIYDHASGIMGTLKRKISSETFNPIAVSFYREVGYRPEALINYLLLLGWSLDGKTEMFTRGEMVQHFSLERVNKSAASFDPQKLLAFQERHMLLVPMLKKSALMLPYLQEVGLLSDQPTEDELETLMATVKAAGDRIKVDGDILDYVEFFQEDLAFPYNEKVFDKRVRAEGVPERLARFRIQLETVEPFDTATLDDLVHRFVEAEEIKIGQIIHALRVAVTGKGIGFGMFETLAILGRSACLARIDRALARVDKDQK